MTAADASSRGWDYSRRAGAEPARARALRYTAVSVARRVHAVQRLKSFSECSSKFTITAQLFTRFTPSLPEPTLSQSGVDSPAQRRLQPARTQRLALVALMTSTCLVSPTSPRQQLVLLYCVRHTQRASAPLGCQDSRSATGVGSFHHAPLLHTSHHAYCTSLASIEGCARVGRAASRAPPPPTVSLLPRCRLRVLQLAPRRLAPGRSVARCSVRGYDEGVRVDGDGLSHLVRLVDAHKPVRHLEHLVA